ncbi:hypothetical protein HDE_00858 [Halotydeus destructor]|nr:hypothetical protein HDE_00858 [Halotydeus destructor]
MSPETEMINKNVHHFIRAVKRRQAEYQRLLALREEDLKLGIVDNVATEKARFMRGWLLFVEDMMKEYERAGVNLCGPDDVVDLRDVTELFEFIYPGCNVVERDQLKIHRKAALTAATEKSKYVASIDPDDCASENQFEDGDSSSDFDPYDKTVF